MAAKKSASKKKAGKKGGKSARTLRQEVLAGTSVTLDDGRHLQIKPWGIELQDDLLPILAEFVMELVKAGAEVGEVSVQQFLLMFTRQCSDLVQFTIGWNDEEMRALTLADSFRLQRSVINTCVFSEAGEGPLGEFIKLYTISQGILLSVRKANLADELSQKDPTSSTKPSARSSRAATRLKTSEATRPS